MNLTSHPLHVDQVFLGVGTRLAVQVYGVLAQHRKNATVEQQLRFTRAMRNTFNTFSSMYVSRH